MKTELIEKLLEAHLDGAKSKTPEPSSENIIGPGDYVIVRCRDAGVHAGYLVCWQGREVQLKNSRRLWYWKCANNKHSLSGVAIEGITGESKITDVVSAIVLTEACEILATTPKSHRSIEDATVYTTA